MGVGESTRAMPTTADAAVLVIGSVGCPRQDADRMDRDSSAAQSSSSGRSRVIMQRTLAGFFPEHRQRMQDNDGSSG